MVLLILSASMAAVFFIFLLLAVVGGGLIRSFLFYSKGICVTPSNFKYLAELKREAQWSNQTQQCYTRELISILAITTQLCINACRVFENLAAVENNDSNFL